LSSKFFCGCFQIVEAIYFLLEFISGIINAVELLLVAIVKAIGFGLKGKGNRISFFYFVGE